MSPSQNTAHTQTRRFSWRRSEPTPTMPAPLRATTFPPPSGWVLETVYAYNLRWPILRQWLCDTFKKEGGQFSESQNLREDEFIFYAPRQLQDHERTYIDMNLRETAEKDKDRQNETRARTPDPPMIQRQYPF
ncbi:hypothetical protein HER10_EVM0008286 [Colletotrichum scovillei]|uniref:Uncharacterized protein n=1 Tax=Colletotrichum scovillei TaxID=1209932 RepID=A0A9P7UD98_9PEZI|nr:uncharacterized protein HER10_EVM0008286 [Colletotrichum scovillei]KAF4776718.1 hypothetical protein HER10_EVM0008286 [Colletotrichum scovillei]KAG7047617.1 hypothetical protein JMJ77_0010964 [Colletotrichum scovillei]KAG7059934.1 hypothetical protein JMJ78_0015218 [Colletotrichum scovillei]